MGFSQMIDLLQKKDEGKIIIKIKLKIRNNFKNNRKSRIKKKK